ncbi:MAG TPA: ABC transporter permease [Candidatus Saccharimonadia bacterium]|nr:ABC transporter permease [Candidatus Saccharimonadia bacterium]
MTKAARAIVMKDLQQRRGSLIGYSAIAAAFLGLYASLFPSIKQQADSLSRVVASLPKAVVDSFGFQADTFTNLQRYLAVEFFSLTWPLLMILLAVSRAGGALAGEVEQGTMGALLALPVSRTRLWLAKYTAGLMALVIFAACSTLVIIPLAALANAPVEAGRCVELMLLASLFGATIYALAMAVSAVVSERGPVYLVLGGISVAMYVLNIVSNLKDSLSWLKYGSIFHYFDAVAVLGGSQLDWQSVGVLLLVAVAASVASWLVFLRRDITV